MRQGGAYRSSHFGVRWPRGKIRFGTLIHESKFNVRGPGYWPGIYWHLNIPPIILRRIREEMIPDYWPVFYR